MPPHNHEVHEIIKNIFRINDKTIMKYNVVLCENLKEPFVWDASTEEVTFDEWPYNTGVITKVGKF